MTTQNLYDLADTWNDAGTVFTGLKLDVTDTASNAASRLFDFLVGGSSKVYALKNGAMFDQFHVTSPSSTTGISLAYYGAGVVMGSAGRIALTSGTESAAVDAQLLRGAAGIFDIRGTSASVGGALNFLEQTAPSAPDSDEVVVYAQDNGAGKTQLMARFASGAAQQIAIEP